jgi:hypothetical protein
MSDEDSGDEQQPQTTHEESRESVTITDVVELTTQLKQLFEIEWGDEKILLAWRIFGAVEVMISAGFDWNVLATQQIEHMVNYFHVAVHMVKYTTNKTELSARLEQQISDILACVSDCNDCNDCVSEWSDFLSKPDAWDNRNLLMECLMQNHLTCKLVPLLVLKFKVNLLFAGHKDLKTGESKNENCCFIVTIKLLNLIKKYVTKINDFTVDDKEQLDLAFAKWVSLFESINKRTDIDFELKVMLINTKDTRGYTVMSLLKHNKEQVKQHVFADQIYANIHSWLTKQQYQLITA